jgi:hypothetical protein
MTCVRCLVPNNSFPLKCPLCVCECVCVNIYSFLYVQDIYKLSETKNVEVLIRWIMLNLQNENVSYIFPVVEEFVSKVRLFAHAQLLRTLQAVITCMCISASGCMLKQLIYSCAARKRSIPQAYIQHAHQTFKGRKGAPCRREAYIQQQQELLSQCYN